MSSTEPATESDRKTTSPELVINAIKQGILHGRYAPGQRLIEADLQRDLRVSRGPVREGLTRIAAEGVVTQSRYRGAYIRALSRNEVLELLQVLGSTFTLAVSLAAAKIRRDQQEGRHGYAQKLTEAYEQLMAQGPSGDRVLQSIRRTRFYDVIFEIADNRELTRINPVVPTQLLRMQIHSFLSPESHQRQFADYKRLYQALMNGDPKEARWLIKSHIRYSRIQILHLPDEAFATEP
ncbi:MAG: GntR family transcriptional regulator [Azonexus sp.]|jgi:DNA-binding GntR family transcriptional regulator|nr:GntR family transcriptional regulator [Azonexus sp.]